ncbi:hypothetical protein [Microbacterium sp. RG1]|uniref:hypothetical protein n=1 Tax=Microbacterium sp. RG1 TaxID=2489212 RepID=UPI001EE177BC|nr:hypothetical protein [Microbacterium sp. RG1]
MSSFTIDDAASFASVEVRRIAMAPNVHPGAHWHNGPVFGVVESGSVFFQVKDQPLRVLHAGDTFFEPGDTTITRFDATDEGVTFLAWFPVPAGIEPELTMGAKPERVSDGLESLPSPWGVFTRDSVTSIDGEVRLFERFSVAGEPHLTLETGDTTVAAGLLPRLEAFLSRRALWEREATDAVVVEFSTEDPTQDELDEAAADLRAAQIVVFPDAAVTVHFNDTCGQHFLEGYWPAVHFSSLDAVTEVSVES